MNQIQLVDRNILVTSNEAWGDVWYSKHNYAYELSKRNRVVFLNPQRRWRFSDVFGCRITTSSYSPSLLILEYNNVFPILNRTLFRLNNFIVSKKLKTFFTENGFRQSILWAFDPYRLYDPRALGVSHSIYHVVDPYKLKSYGELRLVHNADVILCTLKELASDYRGCGKEVRVIPHGISSEEFIIGDTHEDLPELPQGDYGLYVGAIDYRVNFALLERMLKQFPDTPFVLIGLLSLGNCGRIAQDIFVAKKYKNLYYHPPLHFKKLKFIIAKARFCLVINTMMARQFGFTSSHKLLQYFALGKPVFQSASGRQDEWSEILYMDDDGDELIRRLGSFLQTGESRDLPEKRIRYAQAFTFEEIFKRVEECLGTAGPATPTAKNKG